ncbi:aspartyl protease family protein [Bacteroides cellulosilyticus]|jgi:uncharacterized protein YchJ|uniref:aspartyl protease family protein n=1 Tax=Bacteroides cellulosilyticus TaxID=246787 RepID=UPI0022E8406D|nr:aspartyl protease family protein [Bacteroides cellulosilyticus]
MAVHALTHKHEGIANSITTPVELRNTFTGDVITTRGIWDTGATNSVITKSSATKLGLVPVQKAIVNGVHGPKEVNVYFVNITLNNKSITMNTLVTECEELSATQENGMLIGMNIISLGDFTITNLQGNTVMSFRVPSQTRIDYVEEISEYNKYLKIHEAWMRSGNDKCPCKSGKKYKNCHGKLFDE